MALPNTAKIFALDNALRCCCKTACSIIPPRVTSNLFSVNNVSPSTQNQALHALLFVYYQVLAIELPYIGPVGREKKPDEAPPRAVLTCEEVAALLAHLSGTKWLMASLLYG